MENHPSWKGGKKPYGWSWEKLQKQLHKENGGTCEKCKKKKRILIHHKMPVRFFTNPYDAHFRKNLIAVCLSCHAQLHKKLKEKWPLLDLIKHSIR